MIARARATPFAIPLARPLAVGGARVTVRCGAVVELTDEEGRRGLGEAVVPLGLARPRWSAALLAPAVEAARLDLAARRRGVSLAAHLGTPRRTHIAVNALLDARAPDTCAAQAAALVARGFRCLKLKLAPDDLNAELQRCAAVRDAVGDGVALRADANGAWTVEEAIAALRALARFELEYVEQPVRDAAAMAAVRRAVPVRLAADESAVDAAAVEHIARLGAADVVIVKPAWLGLAESGRAIAAARGAGLTAVVTSALDTGIGIAAAAHLAATLDDPLPACGLATAPLLAGDLARPPLDLHGGALALPDGIGLGVELDCDALARWRSGDGFDVPLGEDRAPPVRSATGPSMPRSRAVQPGEEPDGREPQWLDQRADADGGRVALIGGERAWTFAHLRGEAERAAGRLHAAGIGPGQRVALLIGARMEFAGWLHALARLGAVAVPIGVRLRPPEVRGLLEAAACDALCHETATAATVAALPAALVETRVDIDGAETGCAPPRPRALSLEAPHSIVFTSGSTGRPKAVVLTFGNHLASARASAAVLGVRDDDRWLACLPFHHVGGLAILMRSAVYGMTVVVHERFDPERVSRAIDADAVTIVSLVSNMLQRVLDARGGRAFPPHLRCVLLGGGPIPRALLEECRRRGVPVAPTYGMTEAASQIATLSPGDVASRPGSVGRPLPGLELRITCDGAAVPAGEIGEIEVRGANISPGTLDGGRFTATAAWLATGDLGSVDADGCLTVIGRADDVIITGGENVHPREVEVALESHPAVAESCVFGLPDARWGECVAAAVRPRAGGQLDTAELIAHVRTLLASFKVPRRLAIAADFPRTAAGKIQRRAVREAALGAAEGAGGGDG
ncbi:MAG: o-succinylbenzoate--CoA ligase [Candidatus Binatia bacterium]